MFLSLYLSVWFDSRSFFVLIVMDMFHRIAAILLSFFMFEVGDKYVKLGRSDESVSTAITN